MKREGKFISEILWTARERGGRKGGKKRRKAKENELRWKFMVMEELERRKDIEMSDDEAEKLRRKVKSTNTWIDGHRREKKKIR